MPSGQARIDIWNAALDILKEQPVSSINDTAPVAKWLERNYEQQRDYLLGRYHWKFALTRQAIPKSPTAPAWGWLYQYPLPTDCLRIIPPTENGAWNGRPIPFEEESGMLLCDVETPLRLRYIRRVDEEGTFSNDFCELFALRLSFKMSHWISGKQSMTETIRGLYTDTLKEVKDAAAVQMAGDHYYDDDILEVRNLYG